MRLSIVSFVLCSCFYQGYTLTTNEENCGEMFLTVSSIKDNIEINWNFHCHNPPNRIRLYAEDPQKQDAKVYLSLQIRISEGHFVTNITFDDFLPLDWDQNQRTNPKPGPQCLKYWAAAYRNTTFVQKTCLKVQPTWMETNGDKIEDISLGQMFIPGTHNSGSYDNGKNLVALVKYVFTQDRDIWSQLVFGIRYFDVRVGYYNMSGNEEFFVNHDVFKINPLLPMLRAIKLFLSQARKEVVILDFHRFPVGFRTNEKEMHKKFVNLLYKEIGDIAIPRYYQKNRGPTLREIWKQNKRLIICYGNNKISVGTNWLWDPLSQYWGNLQTSTSLIKYLRSAKHSSATSQNPFWAAMAELTPSTGLILFGILSSRVSLAHLADQINRNVTNLYRYELSNQANIVATDFFLGNDIIDIAIKTNINKSRYN